MDSKWIKQWELGSDGIGVQKGFHCVWDGTTETIDSSIQNRMAILKKFNTIEERMFGSGQLHHHQHPPIVIYLTKIHEGAAVLHSLYVFWMF